MVRGKINYPSTIPAGAKDLISKLCTVDQTKRLGNLSARSADVKSHAWFEGIDWAKMYKREEKGPIVPQIKSKVRTEESEQTHVQERL